MESFFGSEGMRSDPRVETRTPEIFKTETDIPCPRTQRVLIVEDNGDSAQTLRMILGIWGHDAWVAQTGDEALDLAREHRPDVILLDLGLPDMDGYTVARAIRVDPWLREATILAMTGQDGEEIVREAKAAGIDHYLLKPIRLEALERLLTDLAENRDARRSGKARDVG